MFKFGAKVLSITVMLLLFNGCAKIQDFGAYKTGTEVSQATMDSFIDGKTKQKDVVAAIGHPNDKSKVGKVEIWKYNFTKIRHIGSNVNESAVFEWNSRGVLKSHYKTNGGGNTGNALLDAAGY